MPGNKPWMRWKALYKAAQGRERVRAKAGGGTDSFGGVNPGDSNAAGDTKPKPNAAAAATDAPPTDNAGDKPFTVGELEACFDNLANAAKAERSSLEELVKSLVTPTTTNSELVAANKKLANEHANLQRKINGLRKRGGAPKGNANKTSGPQRSPCRHCGLKNHAHADCLELPQNALKRPAGWESKL